MKPIQAQDSRQQKSKILEISAHKSNAELVLLERETSAPDLFVRVQVNITTVC